MADVQVVNNTETSRFEAVVEGNTAFAEYRLQPGAIVLPHTVVPPELEGRGIAGALARFAFAHARKAGLKVVPTCPYMASWVKKHPEEQDLLDDVSRRRLGLG